MTKRKRRELHNALLFISPWIIGFSIFYAYPIAASLWYSLCDFSVLKPAVFIGPQNYQALVLDPVFWQAVYNTAFYALFALPLMTITAVALALLLNTGARGMAIYRTIFFLPSLTPMVALAILWWWLLNGEYGVLNHLLNIVLHPLGIQAPAWLDSPVWSKPALVLMSLWTVGHAMVIYLAGLQEIPTQLYEAAAIDGASKWAKFRHVTIPLLSPVIFFNVVIGIIMILQVFTVPYVITKGEGGPARSMTFYAMYMYDLAFRYLRMGSASAMAWLLFLAILGLTLVVFRVSRERVYYAGK